MRVNRPLLTLTTAALTATVLLGCTTTTDTLPNTNDPTIHTRQTELAATIQTATTRTWGTEYGDWSCRVRYLGTATDTTTLAWASCSSHGNTYGAWSSPVTIVGDTVTIADDGDRYDDWVRARFPQPLAQKVIERHPSVLPPWPGTEPSPTPPPPASVGYTPVTLDTTPNMTPYACGHIPPPPLTVAQLNTHLQGSHVDIVVICRNPTNSKEQRYTNTDNPLLDTPSGTPITSQHIQHLLDVLTNPPAPSPAPNTCPANGATPTDPLYLHLTNATIIQPVIPSSPCEREHPAVRRTVNAFP